jgi:hypothetical protein
MQSNDTLESLTGEELFRRHLPELLAITKPQLLRVNLDIPSVVTTTLGCMPKLRALRDDIASTIRTLNFTWLDNLEEYALALNHTHAVYLAASRPRVLVGVAAAAQQLRAELLASAHALAQRGLVPAAQLRAVRRTTAFSCLATDLTVLAQILGRSPVLLDGRAAALESELAQARSLASRLLHVKAERASSQASSRKAMELRVRAFTAFMRAYEEARHAVLFVRRYHGDADRILPSLFATRFARRRKRPRQEVAPKLVVASLAETTGTQFAQPPDAQIGEARPGVAEAPTFVEDPFL